MNNKLTKLEEAKIEFKNRGFDLIEDTYLGASKKATCLDKLGYKYVISLHRLKTGRNPRAFDINNPYTIENIKLWLSYNNKDLELISTEYVGINEIMEFRCVHNPLHITKKSWSNVKKTHSCAFCSGKTEYTTEVFKNKLKDVLPDIEVLSEYKGIYSDVLCRCKVHGNTFSTTARYLLKGNGCKMCSDYGVVHTLESFKKEIKSKYGHIKVIDIEYNGTRNSIRCYCEKHNIEFSPLVSSLLSGIHGCPDCTKEATTKENHYCWKGGVSATRMYLRGKMYDWKKETMIACNYKCDITGSRFDDIHHLYGFDQILEEVLANTNIELKETISEYSNEELKTLEEECIKLHEKYGLGVCLCREMHEEFHKIYGYGNNTPEQYYEFKNNKLNNKNSEEVA